MVIKLPKSIRQAMLTSLGLALVFVFSSVVNALDHGNKDEKSKAAVGLVAVKIASIKIDRSDKLQNNCQKCGGIHAEDKACPPKEVLPQELPCIIS